jgi:hypothetical protein
MHTTYTFATLIKALNKDSENIIKLLGENRMILPDTVPIEIDMG